MKEQSVKSLPGRLRCERPCTHDIGTNGNFATTRPSKLAVYRMGMKNKQKFFKSTKKNNTYMLLNMDNSAVNVIPMANIDFILTIERSRL